MVEALGAPSLYDDALAALAAAGFDVPATALPSFSTLTSQLCEDARVTNLAEARA